MAQGYVYDPSQQISQSFQQAGSSIGNIFSTLVAQKQRDYNLAENAFNNIEALKKNLNIFGQKNVTEKSNALLKEASAAIFKDGKIDYSKMGEIRQKVSDINDLKQGYDLGAKEFERMVQLGVANKDNLISFEKFYKDLSTKMADENLVKNPQDLQRQMADTYTNNLDINKMFVKSYLAANPLEKQSRTIDVKDAKGNIIRKVNVASEAPTGWSVDANGNKVIPQNAADTFLAQLQQSNPELLDLMKKRAGVAGGIMNDRDLVNAYISKVPTSIVQKEEKSQVELETQQAQADLAKFKAKTAPQEFATDQRVKEAQIGYYGRKGQEPTTPNDYAQQYMYQDSIPLSNNRAVTVSGAPLGKPMKLNIGSQQAVVTDIAKSTKSGDLWAKVYVDDNDALLLDENSLQGAKTTWRKIKNPSIFTKQLGRAIDAGGFSNKDKPYARALVAGVLGAPSENLSQNKSANPTTKSNKIPVTEAEVKAEAKNQGVDYNEYKAYLESKNYIVK